MAVTVAAAAAAVAAVAAVTMTVVEAVTVTVVEAAYLVTGSFSLPTNAPTTWTASYAPGKVHGRTN